MTYRQDRHKVEQEEDEELSRFPSQSRQEVQDNIEAYGNDELDRNVCNDTSHRLSERMVESIGRLLLDNRALAVQGVDF